MRINLKYPYPIEPIYLNGTDKWYIQVDTKDKKLGKCLLLDKRHPTLPIPVEFESYEEAYNYIQEYIREWMTEKVNEWRINNA